MPRHGAGAMQMGDAIRSQRRAWGEGRCHPEAWAWPALALLADHAAFFRKITKLILSEIAQAGLLNDFVESNLFCD
ncbi:unnamed protein product [Rangifer tarandus platyrhynchus]|uniref:Uncharacterized protein n=1 Tax=Rangifer tarandus platyrhynchus TaxID=3082113 RepID=A0ABN8YAU6_RANTA|nr:unnamed protein product [Rangifer tarandus platyrhynchus]